jgi:DNA-binding cell septation regulator SpoVG
VTYPEVRVYKYVPNLGPCPDLVAWVNVVVGETLAVSGIRLIRNSATGRYYLKFPRRRGAYGRSHHTAYPVTSEARRRIENAVFAAFLEHERARHPRPAADAPRPSPVAPAAV